MSGIEVIAATLMAYAVWSTGLPNPNTLPEIEVMPMCDIENDFMGRPQGYPCDSVYMIGASYSFNARKILYPAEIPIMSVRGQSFLLHEITHYVQDMAIRQGSPIMLDLLQSSGCEDAAYEPMAYRVQFEWMRWNKVDPWTTIPIDLTALAYSSICRPAYTIDVDG